MFFTDEEALTKASTATMGSPDLYEFKVTSGGGEKLAGDLTDLTIPQSHNETGDVRGVVIGSSEEGSYLYFVAAGVLGGQGGMRGDNLYVMHENGAKGEWETGFIASLAAGDEHDWSGGPVREDLGKVTSRVSPNGRFVAFMSERSLTGYDNLDAGNGESHDEEVYLYDAESHRLVCASCNPTGARPFGVFAGKGSREGTTLLVDRPDIWTDRWLAGSIPGWSGLDTVHALYQSRYLSDSGRLFFDSPDGLVPQATDGKENVYEYEPEGVGSCTNTSLTFSEQSGGCVALMSSGTSGEESVFLDASESGDDAFFLTSAKLVPEDVDNALDVYDAHVCGSEGVGCPTAVASPPECVAAESCRSAPAPQPEIFGASGSATFAGADNSAPPAPTLTAKPKVKDHTEARRLAKALRACRAERVRYRRDVCEGRAKKRFGPRSSAKGANQGRN